MMDGKKMTRTTKILLTILICIILGAAYYFLVQAPVSSRISNANDQITTLQDEMLITETRVSKQQSIEKALEGDDSLYDSTVESYNNIKNEMQELNAILKAADTYSLNFEDATASGIWVRRNFSVTYTASSYETAKKIMEEIYSGPYRCMITYVDFADKERTSSDEEGDIKASGDVTVSLQATYFETTVGASNQNGLIVEESTDTSEEETEE